MKKIVINGDKELTGSVKISGAKNSVVALIPAAIMTDEEVEILNVPRLSDTENLEKIINLLGADINFYEGSLKIKAEKLKSSVIPAELSSKLRASYYFMGALLGRLHHVEMDFPGGCKIGKRPIDLHLKGFKKLGASIVRDGEKYIIDAKELKGARIYLDFPSVGATINILLAATLADGVTTIENAAREPEINNIIELLTNMGADIKGAGSSTITIKGVKKLHGATVNTISDRIETGTYILIGALAGKDFKVENIIPENIEAVISKLKEMNIDYQLGKDYIVLNKTDKILPANIITSVYPGFPTDLGQPFTVLMTQSQGKSKFRETIYENRMGQIPELIKMGANIDYDKVHANIKGKTDLVGTEVTASDLRAGAALIVAGLIAKGTTKISNIEFILRGYEDIVNKLSSVGADIKIIEE